MFFRGAGVVNFKNQKYHKGKDDALVFAKRVIYQECSYECREKMLRLEHENKMLRMRNSGSEEEGSHVLQSMLDDSNSRKNELETEIRSAENAFISLSI